MRPLATRPFYPRPFLNVKCRTLRSLKGSPSSLDSWLIIKSEASFHPESRSLSLRYSD